MSEPQSNEVWKTEELKEEPKGGFGVAMTPKQFTAMMNHINYVTEETSRREQAVADSLDDLKKLKLLGLMLNLLRILRPVFRRSRCCPIPKIQEMNY